MALPVRQASFSLTGTAESPGIHRRNGIATVTLSIFSLPGESERRLHCGRRHLPGILDTSPFTISSKTLRSPWILHHLRPTRRMIPCHRHPDDQDVAGWRGDALLRRDRRWGLVQRSLDHRLCRQGVFGRLPLPPGIYHLDVYFSGASGLLWHNRRTL